MSKKIERLGKCKLNNQGCLMKIIEYKNKDDIFVEFQDNKHAIVHTGWRHFLSGEVKNPYSSSLYNVGIVGNKYVTHITINEKSYQTKEYVAWVCMLKRCYDKKIKEKNPTYKDIICCKEWLCFENFYEWVHSQDNFDKWINGDRWNLDKDILVKGNKIYSPETCCLVPHNINMLFVKRNSRRGKYPIGVNYCETLNKYIGQCKDKNGKCIYNGYFETIEEAFIFYKIHKENVIKEIAQEEYDVGNITKRCYEAMMNYEVEITD